jgi:hypothetical protein
VPVPGTKTVRASVPLASRSADRPPPRGWCDSGRLLGVDRHHLAWLNDHSSNTPNALNRIGTRRSLQGRPASEESVSLELFKPALRLARHRDLIDSTTPHLHKRRAECRDELRETVSRVANLAQEKQPLT